MRELARQAFAERGEIRHAADGVELLLLAELFGDGDDVDGVAGLGEPQHGGVDAAVRVEREVVGDKQHGGVGDRERLDQHGAEDGHLGVEGGGALVAAADEMGDCCHGASTLAEVSFRMLCGSLWRVWKTRLNTSLRRFWGAKTKRRNPERNRRSVKP